MKRMERWCDPRAQVYSPVAMATAANGDVLSKTLSAHREET
jgi:hypothetical protein